MDTEETKKCAKCGKELCDDCTCETDPTMCKGCCGAKEESGEEAAEENAEAGADYSKV